MKKLLLSLLCAAASVVSYAAVETKTYTHTIASGNFTTTGNKITAGDVTLSNVIWTVDAANYATFESGSGLHLASNNSAVTSWTMKTSAFSEYKITGVSANVKCGSLGGVKLDATVGGVALGTQASTSSTSLTDISVTGEAQGGELVITFTNGKSDGKKAMYINSITVTYEISTGGTANPTFNPASGSSIYAEDKVTISCATAGAKIYYTINGDEPTTDSELYDETIGISFTEDGEYTIKAFAAAEGEEQSQVVTATYTYAAERPLTCTLNTTSFNHAQSSYKAASKNDLDNKITYSAVYSNTSGNMTFNNGNSNGKASEIVVSANSSNYIIKSISIELASGGVKVYSRDNAFTPTTVATAISIPTDANLIDTYTTAGTINVDINAKAFAIWPAKDKAQMSSIVVTYAKSGDPAKEDVTVTFDGGDLMVDFTEESDIIDGRVATASVEGLKLTYSSSNEDVAIADDNGDLMLVAPGTCVITAATEATDKYNAGSASYTLTVVKVYNSLAAIIEGAAEGEKIITKFPMTVGYVNGQYCYVTDGKSYGLVYGTITYEENDVIPAGLEVSYTVFNGLAELKPVGTLPASTEKGEYVIETIDAADAMSQPVCKIVRINNVTFAEATAASGNFSGTGDETELNFYNQFKLAAVAAGTYDVIVVASHYTNKQTTAATEPNQLQPVAYLVKPTTPSAKIDDDEFEHEATFELKGDSKIVKFELEEGMNIWHKFVADNAQLKVAAVHTPAEGYQQYNHETGIELTEAGTLYYYAEKDGVAGEEHTLKVTGSTTGINEISVEAATSTVYDLTGRRVVAPNHGIYIVNGKKVLVK